MSDCIYAFTSDCIYAFTPPGADFPPYINFTRENEAGDLIVTVRGTGRDQATIVLPFEEVRAMVAVLYDYQLLHRLGALVANAKTYTVFINGRPHLIPHATLSYEQIINLAKAHPESTVVAHGKNWQGSIVRKGKDLALEDGMMIEAVLTGSA